MTRTLIGTAAALATCLAITSAALAQGGLNDRFESRAPKVGAPLPAVTGYDAAGNEVKLHEIKGHYTVLVFGCLT